MSSLNDSDSIFIYHRYMIMMHGSLSSHALGWLDDESQNIRFKALAGLANMDGYSVLDAGCGYGDFREIYPKASYIGVEQIPELLDEAVSKYGHLPQTTFLPGNFNTMDLPVCDYVIASGSLNYKSQDPQYIFKAIVTLFNSCRLGLGFNLLNKIIPNELIIAYDPAMIMNYCASISRKVKMINDYSDEDLPFTCTTKSPINSKARLVPGLYQFYTQ